MAKPEWGQKRQCKSCNARFYDLRRNPIECPKCGTEFEVEEVRLASTADAHKARRHEEPVVAAVVAAAIVDPLVEIEAEPGAEDTLLEEDVLVEDSGEVLEEFEDGGEAPAVE